MIDAFFPSSRGRDEGRMRGGNGTAPAHRPLTLALSRRGEGDPACLLPAGEKVAGGRMRGSTSQGDWRPSPALRAPSPTHAEEGI
jgi:hypothetical protein